MGATVLHDGPLLAERVQLSRDVRSVLSPSADMIPTYFKLVDCRCFVSCRRNLVEVLDVTGMSFTSTSQRIMGDDSSLVRDAYTSYLVSRLCVKESLIRFQPELLSSLRVVDEEQIHIV